MVELSKYDPANLNRPSEGNPNEITGAMFNRLSALDTQMSADSSDNPDYRTQNQKRLDSFLYSIPNTLIGGISEVAESLPGIDAADADSLVRTLTTEGQYKDFAESENGYKTLGALATAFVPILGMQKLMRSKTLYDRVEKLTGSKIPAAVLPSRITDEDKVKQFRQQVTTHIKNQGNTISRETTPELTSFENKAALSSALDMFKIGVATDLGIYGLLNESEFFFPEEMSTIETMAMYGVPNAVFSGAAGLIMRHKMKNIIAKAGEFNADVRNASGSPVSEVFSHPGERDVLITAFSAQASQKEVELTKVAGNNAAQTNINAVRNGLDAQITEAVKSQGTDSIYKNVTTSVDLDNAEITTVQAALKEDFSAVFDVVSLEKYTPEKPTFATDRLVAGRAKVLKDIEKLEAEIETATEIPAVAALQAKKEIAQALSNKLEQARYVMMHPDGSMGLLKNQKPRFSDIPNKKTIGLAPNDVGFKISIMNYGDVIRTVDKERKTIAVSTRLSNSNKSYITVKNDFSTDTFARLKRKDLTDTSYAALPHLGQSAVQGLLKRQISKWTPEIENKIAIGNNSPHVILDSVLELRDKFGSSNPEFLTKVSFNDIGVKNWDEIEFLSLDKKYDAWKTGVEDIGARAISKFKFGKGQDRTLADLSIELNLPNDGVTGMHPLMELFTDLHKTSTRSLSDSFADLGELKEALAKTVLPRGDLENQFTRAAQMKLRGTEFTTYDKERKSVVMLMQPSNINPFEREELITAAINKRSNLMNTLKDPLINPSKLVSAIVEEVLRDSNRLFTAKAGNSLVEGGQATRDRATQGMWGLRNQPAILAMDSIGSEVDNLTKGFISAQFEPSKLVFEKIIASNNSPDLDLFNIAVHQLGQGWRGVPQLTAIKNAKDEITGYKIPLEKHAKNNEMSRGVFDVDELPDALAFVPAPQFNKSKDITPLVLTPLAAETLLAINQISQTALQGINKLREAAGLKLINVQPLHPVSKDLASKERSFLLNSQTGEVVSIASGSTRAEVTAKINREIAQAKERGMEIFEATESDLKNYNMVQLEDFTQMVDFSTSFKQTGPAKGTSYGSVVDIGPAGLKDMQKALINQFTTTSKVTRALIFEPEFRQATMAKLSSGLSDTSINKGTTIWDSYIQRAIGQKSGSETQTIGKFYGTVEDVYDKIITKIWDQKVAILKPQLSQKQADKEFNKLNDRLPDYNPFKDSVEYMQNTMKIKPPPQMIQHMGTLNAIAGATMLRMFELGLAAINIMSLPTIIPVVAGALRPRPGQSLEEWKKLNAAWSSTIDDSTAIWNPTRATITGTHFFFSKEGKEVRKLAAERGHLWQKTVEQMDLFTSPSKGYWERMIKKSVDHTSIAVDKTEEWSRGLSYMTFYKLGKTNLGMNRDSSMEFAHQMANRVIGDFRPNNRPQIFQGAAGMPFGLFTTFAWNYMQRVFGYVEKAQFADFYKQMGLQAAFFGAKSLPGFNQYVENFTSNYDGSENLVDRLQKAIGTETTDALLFGSVGGASGIATHLRTDIRLPGSNYLQNYSAADMAPIAGLMKKTYSGVSQSLQSLATNEGINGRQLAEIASRDFPIKGLRGFAQLALGQTVDSRGQIINDKLNTATAVVAKALSMKPLRESQLTEEVARIRSQDFKRSEAREQFRQALRSSFRAGFFDQDNFEGIIKQYGKSTGGDYSGLKAALEKEIEFSLVNKGYLEALKSVSTVSAAAGLLRMVNVVTNENYY